MKSAALIVVSVAIGISAASVATAGNTEPSSFGKNWRMALLPQLKPPSAITLVHNDPEFIGCVYSYHQCEHLAHGRGYFRHFIQHDHYACHHGPSYACYGQ